MGYSRIASEGIAKPKALIQRNLMRVVKILLASWIIAGLAISVFRELPELIERSGNSSYDQSYLFTTIGMKLLFAALSIWLIKSAMKSNEQDDGTPTEDSRETK